MFITKYLSVSAKKGKGLYHVLGLPVHHVYGFLHVADGGHMVSLAHTDRYSQEMLFSQGVAGGATFKYQIIFIVGHF